MLLDYAPPEQRGIGHVGLGLHFKGHAATTQRHVHARYNARNYILHAGCVRAERKVFATCSPPITINPVPVSPGVRFFPLMVSFSRHLLTGYPCPVNCPICQNDGRSVCSFLDPAGG